MKIIASSYMAVDSLEKYNDGKNRMIGNRQWESDGSSSQP